MVTVELVTLQEEDDSGDPLDWSDEQLPQLLPTALSPRLADLQSHPQ